MSLNPMIRLPVSGSRTTLEDSLVRHSLFSTRKSQKRHQQRQLQMLVVEAKGKKGMAARQYQRAPPPPLPKIEDDGNPRFVIFIRMANVSSTSPTFLFQDTLSFTNFVSLAILANWVCNFPFHISSIKFDDSFVGNLLF